MVTPRVEERFNLEVIKKKKERKKPEMFRAVCPGVPASDCQRHSNCFVASADPLLGPRHELNTGEAWHH
jgi:hypothetical protein